MYEPIRLDVFVDCLGDNDDSYGYSFGTSRLMLGIVLEQDIDRGIHDISDKEWAYLPNLDIE